MSKENLRIIVVMPALPFPEHGAEQLDRGYGIRQLKRLGHDIKVIAKISEWQTSDFIKEIGNKLGVEIVGVPYLYSGRRLSIKEKIKKNLKKLVNPLYLDGAAFEYSESKIQNILEEEIKNWKPDLVWFEYTYLWPLYHVPEKYKVPIITRSLNFEPMHFLDEEGRTFINYIKYIPKYLGECRTIRRSDFVLSITPVEKEIYKKLGAKGVDNLALRALPLYLNRKVEIKDRKPLKVFFMGSTYTVAHNKEALRMIIADIAPKIFITHPNDFEFYILGNKFPTEFGVHLKDNVKNAGYVDDLSAFLDGMDIAIAPSLLGAGMQQKIFESLTRGFPTITSQRGIQGYNFKDGEEVLFADTPVDFCEKLIHLLDYKIRQSLSIKAYSRSKEIFSENVLDTVVRGAIQKAL